MYFCTLEIKLWFNIMLCIVSSESISILEEKLIFAAVIFSDWLFLICKLSESHSSFPGFRRVRLIRHAHQVFFFGKNLPGRIHRTTESCSGGRGSEIQRKAKFKQNWDNAKGVRSLSFCVEKNHRYASLRTEWSVCGVQWSFRSSLKALQLAFYRKLLFLILLSKVSWIKR